MQNPLPPGAWVSIGIAVASLIVVPVGVHLIKQFLRALQRAKAAELADALAPYVTKAEHDSRADRLEKGQKELLSEQRDFMESLRNELHTRDGFITTRFDRLTERIDHAFSGRSGRRT